MVAPAIVVVAVLPATVVAAVVADGDEALHDDNEDTVGVTFPP